MIQESEKKPKIALCRKCYGTGKGTVTIHLVTDWAEGGHDAAFDLESKVHAAIDGLSGEDFNGMALMETITNRKK